MAGECRHEGEYEVRLCSLPHVSVLEVHDSSRVFHAMLPHWSKSASRWTRLNKKCVQSQPFFRGYDSKVGQIFLGEMTTGNIKYSLLY